MRMRRGEVEEYWDEKEGKRRRGEEARTKGRV